MGRKWLILCTNLVLLLFWFTPQGQALASSRNDRQLENQWYLVNQGQEMNGQWGKQGFDIGYLKAQPFIQHRKEVVVAVFDDGLDIHHPDLKESLWVNEDEIPGNGVDDDHNGYVDDVHGWDFFNHDATLMDDPVTDYHGTHVSGIIADTSNNQIGISGIADNVKIMGIKVNDDINDRGSNEDYVNRVIQGLKYAVDNGAVISNHSWGWARESAKLKEHDHRLTEAIKQSGLLFVTSAGNAGVNNDRGGDTPSDLPASNIISVAAMNNEGKLTEWSNYGAQKVDVGAPGTDMFSLYPMKPYLGAVVLNKKDHSKVITLGFELGFIPDENKQLRLLQDILNKFNISKTDSILIVDDGASKYYGKYEGFAIETSAIYKYHLSKLGMDGVDTVMVQRGDKGPTAQQMRNYDLVLWTTGLDNGYDFNQDAFPFAPITERDKQEITRFLNEYNGNLLLTGEKSLKNIESSNFTKTQLGVKVKGYLDSDLLPWKYNQLIDQNGHVLVKSKGSFAWATAMEKSSNTATVFYQYKGSKDYKQAYQFLDGTSQAAPVVTGIAAVIMGEHNISVDETKKIIMESGLPNHSLEGKTVSGKSVNLYEALKMLEGMKEG